jgi:uncharacterized membrane protein
MEANERDERPRGAGESLEEEPSDRSRWIAAAAYLGFVALISFWRAKEDAFVRAHASQAVLLFLFECAAVVMAAILGATVGKVKFVGLVVVVLFGLATGLAAFLLSVVGFAKALFGVDWRMPFLGEYRERVPGIGWERS